MASLSFSQKKALALLILRRRRRRRRGRLAAGKKPMWVPPIVKARRNLAEFGLVRELQFDQDRFELYFRLSREQFESLLRRVGPSITKKTTNLKQPISPNQRLAICLRFLASGDSYTAIASSYRLGISTISGIASDVCREIWNHLKEEFLPVPKAADWREIARGFRERWDFPNCLGALDGKHVVIQAPANSGSLFYNYKGTRSVVLMAVVDASYRFRVVDVGAFGRSSDEGIFAASAFGQALGRGTLDLPEDAPLPGAAHLGPMPHTFVADEAFPLRTNLLLPYRGRNLLSSERIFNFRLSRARRVVENAFGLLSARWRIYHRVIGVKPENVDLIVKATVALHNFQRWNSAGQADFTQEAEACPARALREVPTVSSDHACKDATAVRDKFATYFLSAAGDASWQKQLV
ncbi:uncharacterized protein LOC133468394 [Phyllopteryx taeniolatus]|uniref:uncharacterized protein LOC133468394 n=1 Tax=Phyllopteryx taeniolatus TaxID=161469 RepID=UPI002AD25402|nr:uncharacterized protein LOC133468394 [Phyllopteryx taeniolatus]